MFSCCYTSRIVSKLVSGVPIFSEGLRVGRILSKDFELFHTIMLSTSKNIIFLWSVTVANCQQTQFHVCVAKRSAHLKLHIHTYTLYH